MTNAFTLAGFDYENYGGSKSVTPESVIDSLRKISGVKYAHSIFGIYNFLIGSETHTAEELKILNYNVRKIPGIRDTNTMIIVE